MAALRFGTDGVRGRVHEELSLELAAALGRAAAEVLGGTHAVLARDPRESGLVLRDALAAGLSEAGVTPLDLGIAPTPAVAHVAAARGAFGAMISASHNPWFDNGIKFFTAEGSKLSDDQQEAIEARLAASPLAPPGQVPELPAIQDDVGDWLASVASVATARFDRLRVVVDAANGAASHIVGPLLADLGADVTLVAADPDGRNINEGCGSTDPGVLRRVVLEQQADLGLALDGDADRLLCVDHLGRVVDGDHLMAILATDLRDRGRLRGDTVVVTVMSNLGFHKAMASRNIEVHVTPVGDRHILEALNHNRWSFGGEQSGHLVFLDDASTGDGCLSAVHLLDVLARSAASLAELADAAMTSYPQVMRNVGIGTRVENPAAALSDEITGAEAELGEEGRVLIRASGTEPLIRVMVEASTESEAERVCTRLSNVVAERFGPGQ